MQGQLRDPQGIESRAKKAEYSHFLASYLSVCHRSVVDPGMGGVPQSSLVLLEILPAARKIAGSPIQSDADDSGKLYALLLSVLASLLTKTMLLAVLRR
jgi:hypothetical protein